METLITRLSWAILAVALPACSHSLPEYTAKPVPTKLSQPTSSVTVPAAPAPDSRLPVVLTVDLMPLEKALAAAVPDKFSDADHPLGVDYRWTMVRDGEPEVSIQDGLVTVRSSYRGDIESRTVARGCRIDPIYPIVDTTAQLTLRQEGDFLVFGLTNPQMTMGTKPESDAKCNMFNIPVKDQLPELLNRDSLVQQMGQAVERGAFKISLHDLWDRLQGPMAMTVVPMNTQLCLYGKPAEMTVGEIKGTQQQTMIPILVKETPTAMVEDQCRKAAGSPLKVASGSVANDGRPYKVLTSVGVPYSLINQSLQSKLFHQELTFGGYLKDHVVVERATASDASGRMLITVETSGDVKGNIYYWGTPQMDSSGPLMTVPDLQMANESKAMLDEIKIGYWQRIDQQLKDKLQTASTIDLSDRLGKIRSAMTGQHKAGDLTLDMLMGKQYPQRAYSTPTGIVADILLEGTASAAGRVPVQSTPARSTIPGAASVGPKQPRPM